MQSIFISPSDTRSPRWLQAFPEATVIFDDNSLPAQLTDSVIWFMLEESSDLSRIAQWVTRGARVVGLTRAEDPQQAKQVLEAGASGYLHYLAVAPVLQQVCKVIEVGGLWLGVELMRQLVFSTATLTKPAPKSHHLDRLSLREQEVAKAVAAGKSNKEVAKELDITERTVKAHLSAVFEKLKARDRLHLVLILSERQ